MTSNMSLSSVKACIKLFLKVPFHKSLGNVGSI